MTKTPRRIHGRPALIVALCAFAGVSAALAGCDCEACKDTAAAASKPVQSETATMPAPSSSTGKVEKVVRTEEEWRKLLTPEQYRILREKGTEYAFTGKYWDTKTPGTYSCAGCGQVLFTSDSKFDSGCGWPSFDRAAEGVTIEEHRDTSLGMVRVEVVCPRCGGHLGHVFPDGPTETGMRYCINSASIDLKPADAPKADK
jgi:peptide-methionine (R)-S-oxide reductase